MSYEDFRDAVDKYGASIGETDIRKHLLLALPVDLAPEMESILSFIGVTKIVFEKYLEQLRQDEYIDAAASIYLEGKKRYEERLLGYKAWVEQSQRDETLETAEHLLESQLGSAHLDGMADALGISHEEEVVIMEKIGFVRKHPAI